MNNINFFAKKSQGTLGSLSLTGTIEPENVSENENLNLVNFNE